MKYVIEMYEYPKLSMLYSLYGSDILGISGYRICTFSVCFYPKFGQWQIIVAVTSTRAAQVRKL